MLYYDVASQFSIRGRSITSVLGSLPVVICPWLVPATLQSVCSSSVSVRDGSLQLQLGLGDSNRAEPRN